ncbi:hypothetical protein MAP00_002601 [Monascus purpureus]|nr:hypothetical protein MAP00_002601 [Monascus purpureus]
MIRHAKRDEEAGGPGLGVLDTRKRTRRLPDGTIVTRPTKRQSRANSGKTANGSGSRSNSNDNHHNPIQPASPVYSRPSHSGASASEPSVSLSDCPTGLHHHYDMPPDGAPVSPPRSTNMSGLSSTMSLENEPLDENVGIDTSESLLAPMMPGGPYEPFVEPIAGQFDVADGAWQTNATLPPSSMDMDYEDTFNLDTATSFNMPFATTHNYNWLFDASSLNDAFKVDEALLSTGLSNFVEPVPDMWSQPLCKSAEQPSRMRPDPVTSTNDLMLFQADRNLAAPCGQSIPAPQVDAWQCSGLSQSADFDWMGPAVPVDPPKPLLPCITEEVRARILDLVAQACPTTMDGSPIDHASPLLSLAALQSYCDLFFTRFNTSYPIIHKATFDPSKVERLLLAAVISLGATYSSRDAHRLAVAIHDILRNLVFAHAGFSADPDLWVLQTMVLIDCFGKSRAGQKQRDMAQLFHCVLIKLIRRSDCTAIRTSPAKPDLQDLDLEWRRAMDVEQRKRLAILCFMWDTQHATLFSQSLCMSAFEIRSSLACDSGTWEAESAEEWHRNSQREGLQSHLPFLNVLKAYITPNAMQRPRHLNALSRVLLLHGLMSIASDLKRRDQTTLRVESPDLVGAWKARISRSLDLWKADFDADCMNMKLNVLSDLRAFTGHKTSAHALYHTAQITLDVEVLDLQIFAGATHILGRVVTDSDVQRSRRAVMKWVNEDPRSAAKVARHASLILQDAVMNLNDWDDNDAFHYPWCLYLATLGCWAFHLPTSSSAGTAASEGSSSSSSNRALTDREAKNQMTALLVGMTTCNSLEELSSMAGKFSTNGLTAVMAKQLAIVRWAIVHDAMKVLMNLSSPGGKFW